MPLSAAEAIDVRVPVGPTIARALSGLPLGEAPDPEAGRAFRERHELPLDRPLLGWCGARRQQEDRGDCDEPAVPMTTVEGPRKG